MTLHMTKAEREQFLAGLHVGIASIADGDRGPLTAPIWYAYEPGGDVTMLIGPGSRKAELLRRTGRMTLCVQNENPPYSYVSVEGQVTLGDPPEGLLLKIATRYLGEEGGRRYAAGSGGGSLLVSLTPERWLTTDYGKRS